MYYFTHFREFLYVIAVMEDIEKMKIDINVIMQITETVKTKIVLRHFAILTSSTILRRIIYGWPINYLLYLLLSYISYDVYKFVLIMHL